VRVSNGHANAVAEPTRARCDNPQRAKGECSLCVTFLGLELLPGIACAIPHLVLSQHGMINLCSCGGAMCVDAQCTVW